jgi:hypothetical protein
MVRMIVLAQDLGDTGRRTGRAHAGDEPVRHPAVQVLHYLGAGTLRVGLDVARVEVLVGVQVCTPRVGQRPVEVRQRVVRVGRVEALAAPGKLLDLGADEQQELLDLGYAHAVGDALESQSVHAGQQGEGLGRVAAGEFDDRPLAAGVSLQVGPGHVPGGPVLDGPERIEHLQLGVEVDVAQTVYGGIDAHQRRVAYGLGDAVVPHPTAPPMGVIGQ